ncbi:hypothetical protein [Polaromonas sp.]|uniref:hypothetical protein n=1 Tax=Polaromonas sp. TaxID=1869339 RepID=UPI003BAD71E1
MKTRQVLVVIEKDGIRALLENESAGDSFTHAEILRSMDFTQLKLISIFCVLWVRTGEGAGGLEMPREKACSERGFLIAARVAFARTSGGVYCILRASFSSLTRATEYLGRAPEAGVSFCKP